MVPSLLMINLQKKHPRILFWFGIIGITFYMVGPIFFPDAPIRQPELLPVFTLMLGLGQLLRGNDDD